jgi:hypothetical protein
MIPNWMVVDKVVHEMNSVRESVGNAATDDGVDQALSEADSSVRSLSLASDAEAVHRAWRAVARAEEAVRTSIRVASPRRRAR